MNKQAYNKISRIFDDEPEETGKEPSKEPSKEKKQKDEKEDWLSDYEGQLAVDIYQDENSVKIVAPIAGVKPEDLDITITGNSLTIRGTRKSEREIEKENYIAQECYWGSFSRTIELSDGLDSEKANANLKNGVLTIAMPKEPKSKTKVLKIQTE